MKNLALSVLFMLFIAVLAGASTLFCVNAAKCVIHIVNYGGEQLVFVIFLVLYLILAFKEFIGETN